MVRRLPAVAPDILLYPRRELMSRIEDALNRARYIRGIFDTNGSSQRSPGADSHDNGINVLVISDDLTIACLVRNLQSLSQADVIVSDNIAHGMRTLLEQRPLAINDHELRFTAVMLNTLCCYGRETRGAGEG